jgi:hypothetical protein
MSFLLIASVGYNQQLYRGMVVDSAKLTNLPDVHVSIKQSGRGTVTNTSGSFIISAKPTDTLIFSVVGYKPVELSLLFEEDALFILLVENTLMLSEITIRSTRLYPNKINDRTKSTPRTMSSLDGFISPITYLSKLEREKRKLLRVVEENNRTQTFRQVITDPDVKSILMNDYEVTEELYYHLIENFNMQHAAVHYFTDPDAIMEALHSFFEKRLAGR